MDDLEARATLTALVTNLDPDAEHELRHQSFEPGPSDALECPQTEPNANVQRPRLRGDH